MSGLLTVYGITQKTRPITSYKFGQIILVRFPFTDLKSYKKRPAVVVSSQSYPRDWLDVVIMPVTSQVEHNTTGNIDINDWQEAGLIKPSQIKPLFSTVEQSIIDKKLGNLSAIDARVLHETIRKILGKEEGLGTGKKEQRMEWRSNVISGRVN